MGFELHFRDLAKFWLSPLTRVPGDSLGTLALQDRASELSVTRRQNKLLFGRLFVALTLCLDASLMGVKRLVTAEDKIEQGGLLLTKTEEQL